MIARRAPLDGVARILHGGGWGMSNKVHEIRDPIHVFVRIHSDERAVMDCDFFQRLRHLHQLAFSFLVYPGATHRRFEHSLGAMELAGRVFDVLTNDANLKGSVRDIMPAREQLPYWRRAVRMAALCHDIGHLPFSHAAEHELLPEGWTHERLSIAIIESEPFQEIWRRMTPPLRTEDVVKLAVGARKAKAYLFSAWDSLMAEIVVGDVFGVDRMDYLLRDSHHAGVAYGKFDHYRLIDTLRILSRDDEEPTLGIEEGGLHSAEALVLARYFMFSQVYLHPARRVYDIHLQDFLREWLPGGKFSVNLEDHLKLTDNEVLVAMANATRDSSAAGHQHARRILHREQFREFYRRNPGDLKVNPNALEVLYEAAVREFGDAHVRKDVAPGKGGFHQFPVLQRDGRIEDSMSMSETLSKTPAASAAFIFVSPEVREEAVKWKQRHYAEIIKGTQEREETE